MKIPLQAVSHGSTIDMVVNGKLVTTDTPFYPYVLAPVSSSVDESDVKETYRLFSGEEVELYRLEKTNLHDHEDMRAKLRDERSFGMRHLDEIFVDNPDFFLSFPNTKKLKVLHFDIEVLSSGTGVFPKSISSPIIGIGVKINDGPVTIFDGLDAFESDKTIIKRFLQFVEDEDPDVVTTYNGWTFDNPFILDRARIHRLPVDALGRWPTEKNPFWGRLNYDVYNDVRKDQNPSLMNLKDRKLSTIAEHFTGMKCAAVDASNTEKYLVEGPEPHIRVMDKEMRGYLESDVNATAAVFNVYFSGTVALAEFLGLPLDAAVGDPPSGVSNSYVPRIYYTRGLKSLGYMALDRNIDRYPDFPGKFEAAIVKINHRCPFCEKVLYKSTCKECGKEIEERFQKKAGRFPKVDKMDFAAYYASTLITFNLSPETTRFVESYEFDESKYPLHVERKDNDILLHVPDRNYGQTIVIAVDQSKEGFLKSELLKLRKARAEIKGKMKGLNKESPKYRSLYSQQNIYKLLGNKCYGYNGLTHANFGDMMVAIAIVALCRWMTLEVDSWLENKVVEIDTDGFILHEWKEGLDSELTNRLNSDIQQNFGIGDSYIELEHDSMGEAFFYKAKSYVVRLPEGEIIKHGVALKSSRHPKVYDHAINTLIPIILSGKEPDWFEVVNDIKNFEGRPLSDFVLRVRMNKKEEDYESEKAIAFRLAGQVMEATKSAAQPGDQIEYVVTKGKQYTIKSKVDSVKEVDTKYYEKIIDKALEIFDVPTNPAQLSLF
jgi:DNA polymerase elongation subunit (family B)